MKKIAAHPGLYNPDNQTVSLIGTQCADCHTNFFPPLNIGCEVCGCQDLTKIELPAGGTVHSTATVHLYAGKDINAPFTVAEISLDDGPLVRGLLTEVTDEDLIGMRVLAEWIEVGQDENEDSRVEPRFRVVSDGESA